MRRVLHPVILYHILQRVIAAQCRQPPLPCERLYVLSHDVLEAVFLKGTVLVPNHFELAVYLPEEESALEELEGEIVEAEYLEVSSDEEGVLIGLEFASSEFGEDPP